MEKITFVVGNANMRYPLELCIRSLMKYNSDYIERILIVDNNSTDTSKEFFETNPYKNITTIISHDNPNEVYDHKSGPVHRYIEYGLNNTKTKYALISHADVEFTSSLAMIYLDLKDKESDLFMAGFGAEKYEENIRYDGPTYGTNLTRLHEWGLFINKEEYDKFGIGFESHWEKRDKLNIGYDIGSWLYKCAAEAGKKLIRIGNEEDFIIHYSSGSGHRRELISETAKKRLKEIYNVY
jgi:glycosyltransferase involved in cell wall biosynthesis